MASSNRVGRISSQCLAPNPTAADKSGACLCGACTVKVTGDPILCAVCHCESCRKWTGSFGQLVNLYKTDQVTVTGDLIEFHKDPKSISHRKVCAKCHGCVVNDHPALGARDVCGGLLNGKHVPSVHIHYQETVFPIRDGLPKFKDMPKELGGSGDTIAE